MRRWGIAIVAVVSWAACSSSPKKAKPPAPPPDAAVAPAPAPDATPAPPPPPPPPQLGDACDAQAQNCADGRLCLPQAPGGYCTSFCGGMGTACEGSCVETSFAGEVCTKTCASNADCRADEGYICDPTWHGCILPGLAAPKFAACDGEALGKRTFAAAVQVSTPAGAGAYDHEPSGALDPKGDLAALYIAGAPQGKPNAMGLVRVAADGTVAKDATMHSTRENHFDPWVTVDDQGTMHAVWLAFDGGHAPEKNMAIEYAFSNDGGATWSTPIAVQAVADCPDAMPGCMDKPMIASGPGGLLVVLYSSDATDGVRMVTSNDRGKRWSADSVAVPTGSYGGVAIDGKGAIYTVGADASRQEPYGGPDQSVTYAVSTDGKTFLPPVKVSGDGESIPFFFVNPTIAIGKKGHLYVAYASGGPDLAWRVVLATSKDGGKTWTRSFVAASDGACGNQSVPNLVYDPKKDTVHLTWAESAGGGRIVHASCKADGKTCSTPDAVSSAPFAEYSFARHSTKWTGEYQTLVIDGTRRVLHAMWSQTVDENGVPTARIFHASSKLK